MYLVFLSCPTYCLYLLWFESIFKYELAKESHQGAGIHIQEIKDIVMLKDHKTRSPFSFKKEVE